MAGPEIFGFLARWDGLAAQCLLDPLGGLPGVSVEEDETKELKPGGGVRMAVSAWMTASFFGQRYTPEEISGKATDFAPRSPATASEFW